MPARRAGLPPRDAENAPRVRPLRSRRSPGRSTLTVSRSPCASCATAGACRTSTRGTNTTCSSRRASSRRRIASFRWISGAARRRAGCRKCSGLNFVERDAVTRRDAVPGRHRRRVGELWRRREGHRGGVRQRHQRVGGGGARSRARGIHLAGWLPETWRPEDLLNRTDAFVAARADTDVFRARLVAAIGARRADAWFAVESPYRIPAGLDIGSAGPVVEDALRRAGTAPFFLGLASPVTAPAERGAGSNAWVVSGARSATSAPLLANDPHRAFAHPSLRYLVHLNAPGWNVIGAASPWLPGVVIGHNEHVAWGMTAFPADIADVFVERVDPSNPHRVEYRGQWVDTTIVHDPIVMKGQAKPFPFEREYTPNGVLVATDSGRHLAFTVKWSGTEPGAAGELAALAFDRARVSSRVSCGAGALEVADRGRHLCRRRWPRGPSGGRPHTQSARMGRSLAGARLVRRLRVARLAPPRRPAARDAAALRRVLCVGEPERRAGRTGSSKRSKARTFTRPRISSACNTTRPPGPPASSCRCSRRCAPPRNDVEAARLRLLQWDRRVSADSTAAALYVFWEEALGRLLSEKRLGPDLVNDYLARAGLSVIRAAETDARVVRRRSRRRA